ncbi:MAG: heme A synthase [Acidobacteriota bacterium]
MRNPYRKELHYFAQTVAAATIFLIIAGALVTSNDAGLSVPDWPLSHGQLMPEMVGGVFYEHGHRMVATTIGLLTIVLNIWLWKAESRAWVRRLGLIALAAVIAQGILGGVTVLFFLPTPVSVLHAVLAQLFFCLVVTLALLLSPGWTNLSWPFSQVGRGAWNSGGSELRLAALTTAAVFCQLLLGAILRHSGSVDGTKGAVLVTSALLAHLMGALVVTGVIVFTSLVFIKRVGDRGIIRLVYLTLSLLVTQLFLGTGAYMVRIDWVNRVQPSMEKVLITASHVAVGALLLATSLLLTLRISRHAALKEHESLESLARQAL